MNLKEFLAEMKTLRENGFEVSEYSAYTRKNGRSFCPINAVLYKNHLVNIRNGQAYQAGQDILGLSAEDASDIITCADRSGGWLYPKMMKALTGK